MKVLEFDGKDEQVALEKALKELNVSEKNVIYKTEKVKGKIFKSSVIIKIITLKEIQEFVKEYLSNLVKSMGIDEINFESSINNNTINIKMYSSNNSILIGREGKTLKALEIIIKQVILNNINMSPKIILDVENYKDKQNYFLEKVAKQVAREVKKTKVPASLENMNSYQRRIIHNCLNNFKGIKTESEGEEPHRHVVIKPKEEN